MQILAAPLMLNQPVMSLSFFGGLSREGPFLGREALLKNVGWNRGASGGRAVGGRSAGVRLSGRGRQPLRRGPLEEEREGV